MLEPSATNPLPWRKQGIIKANGGRNGIMTLWAVIDANGAEVCRLNDLDTGAEQTVDFIVAMANASACIAWMEVDSERKLHNAR